MKEQPKNYTQLWMFICFVLIMIYLFNHSNDKKKMDKYLTRDKIDTVYANDSAYVIKIQVQKSYGFKDSSEYDEEIPDPRR